MASISSSDSSSYTDGSSDNNNNNNNNNNQHLDDNDDNDDNEEVKEDDDDDSIDDNEGDYADAAPRPIRAWGPYYYNYREDVMEEEEDYEDMEEEEEFIDDEDSTNNPFARFLCGKKYDGDNAHLLYNDPPSVEHLPPNLNFATMTDDEQVRLFAERGITAMTPATSLNRAQRNFALSFAMARQQAQQQNQQSSQPQAAAAAAASFSPFGVAQHPPPPPPAAAAAAAAHQYAPPRPFQQASSARSSSSSVKEQLVDIQVKIDAAKHSVQDWKEVIGGDDNNNDETKTNKITKAEKTLQNLMEARDTIIVNNNNNEQLDGIHVKIDAANRSVQDWKEMFGDNSETKIRKAEKTLQDLMDLRDTSVALLYKKGCCSINERLKDTEIKIETTKQNIRDWKSVNDGTRVKDCEDMLQYLMELRDTLLDNAS